MHTESFWSQLRADVGALHPHERRVAGVILQRALVDPRQDTAVEDAFADAVAQIDVLRSAGVTEAPMREQIAEPGEERWDLLRDLEAARGNEDWASFEVQGGGWQDFTPVGGMREPVPVQISVDPRTPYSTLQKALKQVWPILRQRGQVYSSRSLGARKLALVRLVCLEMPEASWQERLEVWNERHRDTDWVYGDSKTFITAHHDAEESLTGDRHGLAWYYSAKARLPLDALHALARQGDPDARREVHRRQDVLRQFARRAGVRVVTADGDDVDADEATDETEENLDAGLDP